MYYITSLLTHLRHVRDHMAASGGEAMVSAGDAALHLRIGEQVRHLQPQFSYTREGRRLYTTTFEAHVVGFVGWRPYPARSWPLAQDKRAFKTFAASAGLRTPPGWPAPSDEVKRFIVKQSDSSLGRGIRGPFATLDLANAAHRLADGEFYEAFALGRILKAWYWDGTPLAVELRPPPSIVGDGHSTVFELASQRATRAMDRQALAWLAAALGLRLDDKLEQGKRLVVDFRYGSPYDDVRFDNENVWSTVAQTSVGQQLRDAGRALQEGMPAEVRGNTLYTIDAVVDAENRVWLLGMNSNPMVHPDAYPTMLSSVFKT
jgi:hypothetical protein